MVLLIDGFNLIYKFPDLEEKMLRGMLDDARAGLLDRLKEFQKLKKSRIRIVFDGTKGPSRRTRTERIGTIDVYYSLDYSADFLIKEFIKKDPNPKMTTVVTSDKDTAELYDNLDHSGVKNGREIMVIFCSALGEVSWEPIKESADLKTFIRQVIREEMSSK